MIIEKEIPMNIIIQFYLYPTQYSFLFVSEDDKIVFGTKFIWSAPCIAVQKQSATLVETVKAQSCLSAC